MGRGLEGRCRRGARGARGAALLPSEQTPARLSENLGKSGHRVRIPSPGAGRRRGTLPRASVTDQLLALVTAASASVDLDPRPRARRGVLLGAAHRDSPQLLSGVDRVGPGVLLRAVGGDFLPTGTREPPWSDGISAPAAQAKAPPRRGPRCPLHRWRATALLPSAPSSAPARAQARGALLSRPGSAPSAPR